MEIDIKETKEATSEAEKTVLEKTPYSCGYCGSTRPLIPYEEMYGPDAHGWPCCPDCGGV